MCTDVLSLLGHRCVHECGYTECGAAKNMMPNRKDT